jgi:hypothetical protein
MDRWRELLERAGPGQHIVQLYGEDDQLILRSVSRYLAAGLSRGDGLLVVATREHGRAIDRRLREEDPRAAEAMALGRLVFLDASDTLAQFTVDGRLDRALFERILGEAIRQVRRRAGSGHVRAFGEMVGLLWAKGQCAMALELEDYWNGLLERSRAALFCAYAIHMFGDDSDLDRLEPILGAHTHLFGGPGTLLSSRRAAG